MTLEPLAPDFAVISVHMVNLVVASAVNCCHDVGPPVVQVIVMMVVPLPYLR